MLAKVAGSQLVEELNHDREANGGVEIALRYMEAEPICHE